MATLNVGAGQTYATLAAAVAASRDADVIFVIQGDVTIQNLSFSGAAVADRNSAGIRYEGGNLVIIDSYFHDNRDVLLANNAANGTIRIVGSEFANNGSGDGFTHITSMSATSARWSSITATSTTPASAIRSRAARNPQPSPTRAAELSTARIGNLQSLCPRAGSPGLILSHAGQNVEGKTRGKGLIEGGNLDTSIHWVRGVRKPIAHSSSAERICWPR